jgi:hypothetical protein
MITHFVSNSKKSERAYSTTSSHGVIALRAFVKGALRAPQAIVTNTSNSKNGKRKIPNISQKKFEQLPPNNCIATFAEASFAVCVSKKDLHRGLPLSFSPVQALLV